MKKVDLINDVAEHMRVSRGEAEEMVSSVMHCIKEALLDGDDVILTGIGKISTKYYGEVTRKIPFLGYKEYSIPGHRRMNILTFESLRKQLTKALDGHRTK